MSSTLLTLLVLTIFPAWALNIFERHYLIGCAGSELNLESPVCDRDRLVNTNYESPNKFYKYESFCYLANM